MVRVPTVIILILGEESDSDDKTSCVEESLSSFIELFYAVFSSFRSMGLFSDCIIHGQTFALGKKVGLKSEGPRYCTLLSKTLL